MNWRTWLFALGLVWGALLLSPGSASPIEGPALLDITQTQTRQSGTKEKYPGAQIRWVYALHNRRLTTAAIGYSVLSCTFIGARGALGTDGIYQCAAVYALKRGKITAAGIVKTRSYYVLAITGGTGIYSNVRGQVLASTRDEMPPEERLLFGLET